MGVTADERTDLEVLAATIAGDPRNLQRAGRRYRSALDALPHVMDPREPTATDLDLPNALQTLTAVDQQLIGLTLEGYSTAEAEQVTGISAGGARTRITRARQPARRSSTRPRPSGTNSIETSLACLSAGTLTWPDGASQTCAASDPDRPGGASLAWTPGRTTFNFGATAGTRWRLTCAFSHHLPTGLATNAAGQT